MNRFSLFTSAEATTTSPTYKGAGNWISWEINTQPGPGILVPRRAEISPLIKTPCTIVFPNLVCFAKSSFKCKGLTSPVSSEKATTSLCVKALLSSARSPTRMCICWKCCLLTTGWFRQILLWRLHHQRRWLEITENIFGTLKSHQQERWACFSHQALCWHQKISFESRGMFLKLKAIQSNTSSLLLPDNARRNGETCKRKKHVYTVIRRKLHWNAGQCRNMPSLQDKPSWCSSILTSILRGARR